MASWASVANINFTRVFSSAAADLVETHFVGSPGSLGVHDVIPGYNSATIIAHDVQLTGTFNLSGYGWDENIAGGGLSVGGLGYSTLVHELGHGLGLDHTHADDGTDPHAFPGVTNPYSGGTGNLNQIVYSVMSYNDGDLIKPNFGTAGGEKLWECRRPMHSILPPSSFYMART